MIHTSSLSLCIQCCRQRGFEGFGQTRQFFEEGSWTRQFLRSKQRYRGPPVTRILGLQQIRVIGNSCYRRSFKYCLLVKRDYRISKVHILSIFFNPRSFSIHRIKVPNTSHSIHFDNKRPFSIKNFKTWFKYSIK